MRFADGHLPLSSKQAGCWLIAGLLPAYRLRVSLLVYQMMSSFLEQFLQFTALVHFANDIGTADKLAVDIELRNGGPV